MEGTQSQFSMSQITAALGGATFVSSITCCLSCFAPALLIATLIVAYLAYQEAKETGEDLALVKVGVALALVPFVLGLLGGIIYGLLACFGIVAGNL